MKRGQWRFASLAVLVVAAHIHAARGQQDPPTQYGMGVTSSFVCPTDNGFSGCPDANSIAYFPEAKDVYGNATIVVGARSRAFLVDTYTRYAALPSSGGTGGEYRSLFYVPGFEWILVGQDSGRIYQCVHGGTDFDCTQINSGSRARTAQLDYTTNNVWIFEDDDDIRVYNLDTYQTDYVRVDAYGPYADPSTTEQRTRQTASFLYNDAFYIACDDGQIVRGFYDETDTLDYEIVVAGCCFYTTVAIDATEGVGFFGNDIGLIFKLDLDTWSIQTAVSVCPNSYEPTTSVYDEQFKQLYVVCSRICCNDDTYVYRVDGETMAIVDSLRLDDFEGGAAVALMGEELVISPDTGTPNDIFFVATHDCSVHSDCGACGSDVYCFWCISEGSCKENRTDTCDVPLGPSECPVIDTIEPASGDIAGGTVVTMTGSNFYANGVPLACALNGAALPTNVVSNTRVECTILPFGTNTSAFDPDPPTAFSDEFYEMALGLGVDIGLPNDRAAPFSATTTYEYYNCSAVSTCYECMTPDKGECSWCLNPNGTTCGVTAACPIPEVALTTSCPEPVSIDPLSGVNIGGVDITLTVTEVPFALPGATAPPGVTIQLSSSDWGVNSSSVPSSWVPPVDFEEWVNNAYVCDFGGVQTAATATSSTTVTCKTPPLSEGVVPVTLFFKQRDLFGVPDNGWNAEFFNDWAFTSASTPDALFIELGPIDFGTSGSLYSGDSDAGFRYTGYFVPDAAADDYEFCMYADDHVRFWVNDVQLVDSTSGGCCQSFCTGAMSLPRYPSTKLVYEWYDSGGWGAAELEVSGGPMSYDFVQPENMFLEPRNYDQLTYSAVNCSAQTSCSSCSEGVGGCGWCYEDSTCQDVSSYSCSAAMWNPGSCPDIDSITPEFVQVGSPTNMTIRGTGLIPTGLYCEWIFVAADVTILTPVVYYNSSLSYCAAADQSNTTWVLNTTDSSGNSSSSSGSRRSSGGPGPGYVPVTTYLTGTAVVHLVLEDTADPNNTVYANFSSSSVSVDLFNCGVGVDASNCQECLADGLCSWCAAAGGCLPSAVCADYGPTNLVTTCPVYNYTNTLSGSVAGGTPLTVTGSVYPFVGATPDSGLFSCRFGPTSVPATVLSATELACVSPAASTAGPVALDVELDGVSTFFTEAHSAAFTYYDCGAEADCSACAAAASTTKPECGWCVGAGVCGGPLTCPTFWLDGVQFFLGASSGGLSTSSAQMCPALEATGGDTSSDLAGGALYSLDISGLYAPSFAVGLYSCLFDGTTEVPATVADGHTLTCYSPPAAAAGTVAVEVMYQNATYTDVPGTFEYYDCGELSCEQCTAPGAYSDCSWCVDTCTNSGVCDGEDVLLVCPQNDAGQDTGNGNTDSPIDKGGNNLVAILVSVICVVLLCVAIALLGAREYSRHQLKKRLAFEPPKLTDSIYAQLVYGSIKQADDNELVIRSQTLIDMIRGDATRPHDAFALCNMLIDASRPADGDKLSRALVHIAEAAGGHAEGLILSRISHEMAAAERSNTLFRTNSVATKMFRVYSKMKGLHYLHGTLGRSINEALGASGSVEVDVNKLANDEDEVLNRWNLSLYSQKVTNCIYASVDDVPPELRRILRHVQVEFKARFGHVDHGESAGQALDELLAAQVSDAYVSYTQCLEVFAAAHAKAGSAATDDLRELDALFSDVQDEMLKMRETASKVEAAADPTSPAAQKLLEETERANNSIAVGGFFFLRFVVPAITAPEAFGIVKEPPTPEDRRLLILVSKVIQNLSNNKYFGAKEGYMLKMNSWITDNLEQVNKFFDKLTGNVPADRSGCEIPPVALDAALVELLKFIELNIERVGRAITGETEEGEFLDISQLNETCLDELEYALSEGNKRLDDYEAAKKNNRNSMASSGNSRMSMMSLTSFRSNLDVDTRNRRSMSGQSTVNGVITDGDDTIILAPPPLGSIMPGSSGPIDFTAGAAGVGSADSGHEARVRSMMYNNPVYGESPTSASLIDTSLDSAPPPEFSDDEGDDGGGGGGSFDDGPLNEPPPPLEDSSSSDGLLPPPTPTGDDGSAGASSSATNPFAAKRVASGTYSTPPGGGGGSVGGSGGSGVSGTPPKKAPPPIKPSRPASVAGGSGSPKPPRPVSVTKPPRPNSTAGGRGGPGPKPPRPNSIAKPPRPGSQI